ncbi:MAG: hypothetical protein KDI03_08295 [Anaerolineae bacterium]|nr:hypothetical protein [Anaerolineae bacterium]
MTQSSTPVGVFSTTGKIWRLVPWALVLLLAALNVLYMSRLGPNDDAYITYRVARNLANGLGPVFNPGERVLSITTPGYMLLLAAGSVVSKDFVALGLALNGVALLAVGALVIDLSSQAITTRQTGGATGSLSALSATLAVGLTLTFPLLSPAIGMETPLFIAAILATFAAYGRAYRLAGDSRAETRWLLWTAGAAALAFLLRPDGVLVAVAVGLHWLVTRRRVAWRPLALYIALSVPWLMFAWLYYGSPVPNTLVAKATQGLGEAVPRWGPGLVLAAGDWARRFLVAAVLAVVGLVLVWRNTGRLPLLLWAVLTIVAQTLLGVRSYFWYYAPFAPVLGLLAGDGLAAGVGGLADRLAQRRQPKWAAGLVALALALAALVPAAAAAAVLAAPPETRQREQAYMRSGEVLRELCAADGDALQVGMSEIGLIGYVSDCPIVDFAGLLQRDVAHLSVSPSDKATWTIQRYQPELVLLGGRDSYPTVLSEAPWFRKRYEPVDMAREEGFRSIIYRRGPGLETQRDLSDASWWRSAEPAQASDQSFYFAPGVSPAITLHVFLPPDSGLQIDANGQPVASLAGSQMRWQEISLPAATPIDGKIDISLTGSAGDQPALVSWIESNALPAVHYFVPLEDASIRPRPSVRLEPGENVTATLAVAAPGPADLALLHRDRPGVALEVAVNGQPLAVVGGSDGWTTERIPLPDAMTQSVQPLEITFRNQGKQFARLASATLVQGNQN